MSLLSVRSVLSIVLLASLATCNTTDNYTYIKQFDAFYKDHSTPVFWLQAVEECAKEGAVLWIPKSIEEGRTIIMEVFKLNWFRWVGFSDKQNKGDWISNEGDKLLDVYDHWRYPEPDGKGLQNCAIISNKALLCDAECYWQYPFICKRDHESHSDKVSAVENVNVPSDRHFGTNHISEFIKMYSRKIVLGANEKMPKSILSEMNWNDVEENTNEDRKSTEIKNIETQQIGDKLLEDMNTRHRKFVEQMMLILNHKIVEAKETILKENKKSNDVLISQIEDTKNELKTEINKLFEAQQETKRNMDILKDKLESLESVLKEKNNNNLNNINSEQTLPEYTEDGQDIFDVLDGELLIFEPTSYSKEENQIGSDEMIEDGTMEEESSGEMFPGFSDYYMSKADALQ